jgi:hypothetical protein
VNGPSIGGVGTNSDLHNDGAESFILAVVGFVRRLEARKLNQHLTRMRE